MKKIIVLALLFSIVSCKKTEEVTEEVKKPHVEYSIEQFYKNTRVGGGVFSEDETKLLVNSDESGIFNLYEVDLSNNSKTQITNSMQESFFAEGYVPGTKNIIYSADKGGNEISHLYLLDENGVNTDLTSGENEKAIFWKWSKDKTHMYYESNKRDSKYFDFYKMNLKDWSSELIYKNDDGLEISSISDDEKMVVLNQAITTSENKLFLVQNKNKIEISEEPSTYNSSGFSKDNKYLYYITNKSKEFKYLVQYDITTKERKIIYETNWDVMYSYLSDKETYRVIGVNEDGKNKLIVKNNATNENIEFPEIQDGDIKGVGFSESEKQIRLTVGTSKASNNIYVYNLVTKDLKKLTNTLSSELNADNLVSAEVVRYKSFDGLEIPAIYYKPLNATKNNKVPALVWVHGGPGGQSRVGYFSLIQYLVNHGYAILAVNNRGSSGYGKSFYKMDDLNHGDKDLKDCIWGKKWLQSQDYIDADKIGIIGGSYGGYMTMAAMTFTPDEFMVGVNIFGVTNWLRTLKSIPPYWESFRNALYKEVGDPYTADSIRLHNISPLFHADQVKNPVMVLQGANDPRVLQVESDEIVAAIKKNNVPVEYVLFPDEGHGFRKKENEIKGYGQILTFLDVYLKKENK